MTDQVARREIAGHENARVKLLQKPNNKTKIQCKLQITFARCLIKVQGTLTAVSANNAQLVICSSYSEHVDSIFHNITSLLLTQLRFSHSHEINKYVTIYRALYSLHAMYYVAIAKGRGYVYGHDNQLYRQVKKRQSVMYLKCCTDPCVYN